LQESPYTQQPADYEGSSVLAPASVAPCRLVVEVATSRISLLCPFHCYTFMPHKKIDGEEWCCQYCHAFKDADYDKVVYHELTQHHAGYPKKEK